MPLPSIDHISDLLIRLRLATLEEILECRTRDGAASSDELLKALVRRQILTDFQVQRIQKNETDGLVLGDIKLMYRNASGSFARVYRGCSVVDGRMLAVKVLRERWASDTDTVRLFHREGEIGQRLKHRNIVPIYDVAAEGKHHYITMEFIEGGNLRDFVKIRGRLSPLETCRYALHMGQALEYALGMGFTHRDLKLTNVLMSSQGIAKLIDFGLAADDAVLNKVGGPDLAQALEYSTLEKNTGAPKNDPRSDLYFLGVILYELLTGEAPYPRTRDREERKRFSRYRDVRPLDAVDPSLPRRLTELVDRLMNVNPNARPQTPTEVIADLRPILSELGEPPEGSGPILGGGSAPRTVLCVEHRPKQQDLLREYLTKHGYRVLMLSDVERALQRVRQTPPDAVLLIGDSIGERVAEDFVRMVNLGRERKLTSVLVLSEKQTDLRESIAVNGPLTTVLTQPVTLRDLRKTIARSLKTAAGS